MSSQLTAPRKMPVLRRSAAVGDVIGAFESETIAVFVRTAPVHEHFVVYALSAMLIIAVTLSAVIKVDRVVTSVAGFIVPAAGEVYVDPYNQSIIRQVNVKAGEVVKKGQPLATLDPTFTQADLLQLQQHLSSDEAQIAREEAQLAKRPYRFSPLNRDQVIQGDLWQKQQAQYQASVANFEGQIHSAAAQMSQARSDEEKYQKRLSLASEAENVYQPLLEKGYVSKLQALQSTDTRTEMTRLLGDAQNQISQYRETIASLQGQREAFIQNWFSALGTQLVADRNDLSTTRDSLDKAQKMQDLTTLDSPVDAIVLKVGKVSQGAIAAPGGQSSTTNTLDPIFTLMPLDAPVEAEIDIASMDNSYIQVGDTVNLKFDAYPYVWHGVAKGVVNSISAGSFTLDVNNQATNPYFKVRVTILEMKLRNVAPGVRAIPGMTLAGDIEVGRRTILQYMTQTILKTGAEAMREPE